MREEKKVDNHNSANGGSRVWVGSDRAEAEQCCCFVGDDKGFGSVIDEDNTELI